MMGEGSGKMEEGSKNRAQVSGCTAQGVGARGKMGEGSKNSRKLQAASHGREIVKS
jgi:hypothetical protein